MVMTKARTITGKIEKAGNAGKAENSPRMFMLFLLPMFSFYIFPEPNQNVTAFFWVIGIMHTFLATAYLIGESSILHLAAGTQK